MAGILPNAGSHSRLFIPGTTLISWHGATLLHVGIRNVVDLLYNPFHLGIRSPDWRRMLLEKVVTLSGRGFGIFHFPTCPAAPTTLVRCPLPSERLPGESELSINPPGGEEAFYDLDDNAGIGKSRLDPWREAEGGQSHDGFFCHFSIPEGSLSIRFKGPLHGGAMMVGPPQETSAQAKGRSSNDQALSMLGDLLVRWEQCDPGPFEIPLLSHKPLRLLPSYPHPVMVVDGLGHMVFRNEAAEAGGVAYDEEWGTFRRNRRNGRRPREMVNGTDAPALPVVTREDGERYRIFRLPVERHDELVTAFIGLPMAPTLPTSGEVMTSHGLSSREGEVALLLAQGLSTKAIARELEVSWHTARGHVSRVLKKLDVNSRKLVVHRVLAEDS